jgi:hypothetical protein
MVDAKLTESMQEAVLAAKEVAKNTGLASMNREDNEPFHNSPAFAELVHHYLSMKYLESTRKPLMG